MSLLNNIMKVALITLYSRHNYGAVLQKYSTYQFLKNNCEEAILIDYKPRKYKKLDFKSIFKDFIIWPRIVNFSKFENKFFDSRTIKYSHFHDLVKNPPQADVYIVGSDQVWNSKLTWNDQMTKKCLDPAFFLDFVKKGKKISFASSIGKDIVSEEEMIYFRDKLENFSKISVREESAKIILNNSGVSDVTVSLDPVFLLNKDEYFKLVKIIKHKKYLLIYSAEKNSVLSNIAKKIAKDKGLMIVEIGNYFRNYDSDIFLNKIGIQDFVSYFNSADFIVTSSFHGLAFSIIFEKQFIAVKPHERATRLTNLVTKAGLIDRLVDSSSGISNDFINYEIVKNNLHLEIENSKKYLIDSIYEK